MREYTTGFRGTPYLIRLGHGLQELPDVEKIRITVFMVEQGFEHEFDDIDPTAVHLLVLDKYKPIAIGRVFPKAGSSDTAVIGRIAVVQEHRGRGMGSLVVRELERYAREHGLTKAELSAQERVTDFYASLGYQPQGDTYYDEFCPHVKMVKELT